MDTAQNTARPPLADSRAVGTEPSTHPPPRESTPHYTIGYSTPAERGGGSILLSGLGWGSCTAPLGVRGWGGVDRGGQRKVYAQGGTGGLQPGSATGGQTGEGAGQWPSGEEMAPGKMKEQRLGERRAPQRSPDPRLKHPIHLVPGLALCLPKTQGPRMAQPNPPSLLGPQ